MEGDRKLWYPACLFLTSKAETLAACAVYQ